MSAAAGFKEKGGTSEQAAHQVKGHAATLRSRIMDLFKRCAYLTPEDAAVILNADLLGIRPRFTELLNSGKIRKTSRTDLNAKGKRVRVWALINENLEQVDLF
jgi:hypothetical protein